MDNLLTLWRVSADACPSAWIGDEAGWIPYAEFVHEVDRLAAGLAEHGIRPFDRVAVHSAKTVPTAAALLAVSQLRAIAVPLGANLKGRHRDHILTETDAKLLLADVADPDVLGTGDWSGAIRPIGEVRGVGHAPDTAPLATDPAVIFYTSGSTGWPKGVVASHANLLAGIDSMRTVVAPAPDDVVLCLLPLSFDAGFNQLLTALAAGSDIRLAEFRFARSTVAACAEAGVTSLTAVPPLWRKLLDAPWPEAARTCMRCCATTGGQVTADLDARLRDTFPAARQLRMYGFTEAFRGASLPDSAAATQGAIGQPIPGAELLVVDDAGDVCPPGRVGEIVQTGPLVTHGYWGRPEATAAAFVTLARNGWRMRAARSGDLGYQTADGGFVVVGRRDEQIKTSGYRVSPSEIEDTARESGLVTEAVAFGEPDPVLGERIVLAVTAARPPLDPATLTRYLRDSVPAHLVPATIVEMTAMPALANGKIDRTSVRARARELVETQA